MANDTKEVYFLPKKLEFVLTHESAAGVQAVPTTVDIEGFKVPGYEIFGDSDNLALFLEKAPAWSGVDDIARKIEGKSGLDIRAKWSAPNGEKRCLLSLSPLIAHDMMDCGSRLSSARNLCVDIEETLKRFSALVGQGVLIASPETKCVSPRICDTSFGIHVVIDASPPGDASKLKQENMCGLELADNHRVISHAGPASGRGILVKDEDGETVAQIIDDSFYLFVPLFPPCYRTLMDASGAGLFKKVLRLAWNAYVEWSGKQVAPEEVPIGNAEEYGKFLDGCFEDRLTADRNLVAETNKEIEELETKIRSLLNDKRLILMLVQQYTVLRAGVDRSQWKKDWEYLHTLSGVKNVSIVDGGIHVKTDMLTTIHEGVKYRLGSFIIRYSYDGIFVWSHKSVHSRGRAHPHISEVGTVCFGNIGIAIRSAVAEARISDAVGLVLRWLIEGYDPELADTRIEEWPREEGSV